MPDEVSNPLLTLIKDQNLIDDLQYEEVVGEFKRTGKPVIQILQDFGVMDLDSILHVIAEHLGTEVVSLSGADLPADLIRLIPSKSARMYQCIPVGLSNGTLKVALMDPLNSTRIDELGFVVKKDLQLVIADPAQVEKGLEKYYPDGVEDSDTVSDILKELGADAEIAREASAAEATDDAAMITGLANEAPILPAR